MRSRIGSMAALLLAVATGGCGDDDNFSPTIETVAGNYSASAFTLTTAAGTVNLLAQGSQVTLNLATDGTTTGQLFVPGGDEDGGDLDVDLTGTWTLSGSTVTFDQSADTFLRDVEFTAEQNRLTGEGDFGDASIRLVLTKSVFSRIRGYGAGCSSDIRCQLAASFPPVSMGDG